MRMIKKQCGTLLWSALFFCDKIRNTTVGTEICSMRNMYEYTNQ